jgi:hypothetical protein
MGPPGAPTPQQVSQSSAAEFFEAVFGCLGILLAGVVFVFGSCAVGSCLDDEARRKHVEDVQRDERLREEVRQQMREERRYR